MTTQHLTTQKSATVDGPSDPLQPLLVLLYTPEHERIGQRAPVVDGLELGRESTHFAGRSFEYDGQMSRRHVCFSVDGSGVQLFDSGSTNGTIVNGERTGSVPVRVGDVIQLGATFLQFTVANRDPVVDPASLLAGHSPEMETLRRAVLMVAGANTPVLVTGPAGAGKRTVGRELHRLSRRAGRLVVVECLGRQPDDVADELFEGSAIQAAQGGTLVVADIDRLHLSAQMRLLWALDSMGRGFERPAEGTARLVATSRVSLREQVVAGRFREDLYTRLSAWSVDLAPLRERPLDVGSLLAYYLDRCAGRGTRHRLSASGDLVWALLQHDWVHNVQQLAAVVEAAAIEAVESGRHARLSSRVRALLEAGDAPVAPQTPAVDEFPRRRRTDDPRPNPEERWQLLDALRQHDFKIARVARHYGKQRNQIYRWLTQFDIDLDAMREEGRPLDDA